MENMYTLQECLSHANKTLMSDAFRNFFGSHFLGNQKFNFCKEQINVLNNLYLPNNYYFLDGDVHCSDTLFLFPKRNTGESTFVFVLGDVDCENLYLLPNTVFFIGGKLKVSNIMYTGGADTLIFSFGKLEAQVNFAISEDVGLQSYRDLANGQHVFFKQDSENHVFSVLEPPIIDTSNWDSFSRAEQNEILEEAGEEELYEYLFVNGVRLLRYFER